jgi:DNA-binding MarR family transcriptional regulator
VAGVSAARLQSLLGLTDEELLRILDSDALAVITGEEDSRPEVRILLQLLREPEETQGPATLRRWLRAGSPSPLQRLLQRDFAGFEDALAELSERGFIVRRRRDQHK